jgi:hypothetical protein
VDNPYRVFFSKSLHPEPAGKTQPAQMRFDAKGRFLFPSQRPARWTIAEPLLDKDFQIKPIDDIIHIHVKVRTITQIISLY